jgi:hypothetical protein
MSIQAIIDSEELLTALALNVAAARVEELAQNFARDEEENHGGGGRGARWVEHCLEDSEQMYEESRLRVSTFQSLVEWLADHGMDMSGEISVEEKLLIFLYVCGKPEISFMHAKFCCDHDVDTISE